MMSADNNDIITGAGVEDDRDNVDDDEMSSSSMESELSDHTVAQNTNSDTGLASTVSLDTGPHA